MSRVLARAGACGLVWLSTNRTAEAHIVGARLGDFYAGALHPLTDLLDVLLWMALGILAGALGAVRGRWLVLIFPIGLVAGLALGLGLDVSSVGRLGDAAGLVVLGLLLTTAVPLPALLLGTIGLVLAVMRGLVNAAGTGHETNIVLFASGLAVAGYVVVTLAMGLTVLFCTPQAGPPPAWRRIALRACGSWIAAIGLMMGGFALVAA